MNKTDYFCIGNLGACRKTIGISMTVVYGDDTEETFTGADMEGTGTKAANTLFEEDDELWISAKHRTRSISKIMLDLNNPNGSVEQYCLKWGISSYDHEQNDYRVRWEDTLLRSDEIRMTAGEDTVHIDMHKKAVQKASAAKENAVHLEKTAEDIQLCIAADRQILSHYTGDERAEADGLLGSAEEAVGAGNISAAEEAVAGAEEKIAGLAAAAVRAVKVYTE